MAIALFATACGTREHNAAVVAAKAYASAHGLAGPVRCTTGVSVPYRRRGNDFLCIAHRSESRCNEVRVDRVGTQWLVRPFRSDVDCVLPA